MKSEASAMNSKPTKVQCETRILPKRRVSKNPFLHQNGGFNDADLTLAIQESLKSARKIEKREAATQENNISSHSANVKNQTRMAGKLTVTNTDCSNSKQEIKQLKELLLLHLEMIRHQEQLLIAKDQEIKILQSEKETLHCRLERMDRRISLLKQKNEPFESSAVRENVHEFPPTLTSERSHKRKSSSDTHTSRKRVHILGSMGREKISKLGEDVDVRSRNGSTESRGSNSSSESNDGNDSAERGEEMETLLKTDNLYHIMCCEPRFFRISDLSLNETENKAHAQGIVETPSWRYITYTNLYQMEGTENIEDETILKRHQKLETEEKKRKRWDLQRIREQRALQKLQDKSRQVHRSVDDGRKHDSNELEVDTLHPRLEDITHLEVSDRLTVNAFGQPLPFMKQKDFDLPWNSNSSPPFQKSSSHSLRR